MHLQITLSSEPFSIFSWESVAGTGHGNPRLQRGPAWPPSNASRQHPTALPGSGPGHAFCSTQIIIGIPWIKFIIRYQFIVEYGWVVS